MAQAATRMMSAVRERHAAHPARPRAATKPGEPSSAGSSRSRKGGGNDRNGPNSRNGGGNRRNSRNGGNSGDGNGGERDSRELSLPGGRELSLPGPHLPVWARLVGKLLKRLARHELRRLAKATGDGLPGAVATRTVGELDLTRLRPGLPIQRSVDIAVPVEFVWQKWMELAFLPEGVDRVVDIERDGDRLEGHVAGHGAGTWNAEILDERDCESFAWHSTEGSDCAGLVTFHRLSERLTRVELTLDVVPQSASDCVSLFTHRAEQRALREMRKFKADLEVVSPDVYSDAGESSSR